MLDFNLPVSKQPLANLNEKERRLLADKMMDLANLGYASLVLGQILAKDFKVRAALLGMVLFLSLYVSSISILKGGR